MDREELLKIKYSIPFLEDLNIEEINDLLKISKIRMYHPGQLMVKEGDQAEGMFIVLKGEVKVEKRLAQGDQLILSRLAAGDVFGEMALIEKSTRSASVKATDGGATLFFIDSEGFSHYRKIYHPASMKILKKIANILARRAVHLENMINEFFENPERSIPFLEKRYLKYVGHPNNS